MTKEEIVLVGLAPAMQRLHSPVQVQKLFFLLEENISDSLDWPHFDFQPYNYGPFDKGVYDVLNELRNQGLVEVAPEKNWSAYRLTADGQKRADALLSLLPDNVRNYVIETSEFVRRLSFSQLVSAIYKAYPNMRVNSVFQG